MRGVKLPKLTATEFLAYVEPGESVDVEALSLHIRFTPARQITPELVTGLLDQLAAAGAPPPTVP
jgi:hypothetical protein